MRKFFHYFVEGEDEERIINLLKTELQYIVPGKVQKFNVLQEKLTSLRLMSLKSDTTVILVFDTDAGNFSILMENIRILQKCSAVSAVVCVTQVKNLEQELIRSCDIRQIRELTNSKSNKDYKRDLIIDTNLKKKLLQHKFDFDRFWSTTDRDIPDTVKNEAYKIKITK